MEGLDVELSKAVNNAVNDDANPGDGAVSPDTAGRIKRVFLTSLHLNLSESDLDFEQSLDEVVGLDSLAVLEFVTALEKEFGIMIEPELLRLDFVKDLPRLGAYVQDRVTRARRAGSPATNRPAPHDL
jgi:acyl carrier protein